ncbi:MAG: nucleoside-diphosphate sugar epimerase [Desulfobacterium sp. 4572_20]|nr:GDP-mannose 4,6-dehydratase [Deltaproteobacteria bacterium]MCD6264998.1 GDP-mannose 4,6-dehydratase [Deltaproteobacteria bacterium]OQY15594.1 MAG: nucleoside-diphosphate sugar epimerase [Desulfobacterium sp. 4572_20]HDH86646.1 NAD-dependent epimerase/dehydratase family protein [Desulfobacteraceae bacterium]
MKILITGGAGFIGSHLADRLLENGDDEVFIVDDLSTGRLANVEQNQDNERFHLVVDTILNEAVMNELVFKCDQIYHMAAAVGVKLIMNRPVETLETNVKGTEMILMLANRYKKRVLIASSSEVYGKIMDGENTSLLVEDTDRLMGSTTKRRWAYACSKALDEFLALAYFEEKKLPVIITRLFNTVGPRQTGQYGMVIPNFVQKALINKPITVYGDGNQSRSFTYIADVIDVLIKLMAEPEAVGKIFNVGNEEEVTIKDLALMVKEMTGSSSEIEYIPYEKAYGPGYEDMQRRCPDITRLKDFMHFKPKTDLKGIIQSVIDYYKK